MKYTPGPRRMKTTASSGAMLAAEPQLVLRLPGWATRGPCRHMRLVEASVELKKPWTSWPCSPAAGRPAIQADPAD